MAHGVVPRSSDQRHVSGATGAAAPLFALLTVA